MKPRPSVRKTDAGWVVSRPRLGFAPDPETYTATTAQAAWRWLQRIEKPRGGGAAAERSPQRANGISAVPGWRHVYRY